MKSFWSMYCAFSSIQNSWILILSPQTPKIWIVTLVVCHSYSLDKMYQFEGCKIFWIGFELLQNLPLYVSLHSTLFKKYNWYYTTSFLFYLTMHSPQRHLVTSIPNWIQPPNTIGPELLLFSRRIHLLHFLPKWMTLLRNERGHADCEKSLLFNILQIYSTNALRREPH